MTEKRLTENQIAFCEEYVRNGYNGTAAYKVAYSNENKNTAQSCSSQMLRLSKIQNKIVEIEGSYRIIGQSVGIDKKLILKTLRNGLMAQKRIYHNGSEVGQMDDYTAQIAAVTTFAKLVGDFAPEKKEIVLEDVGLDKDPSDMTQEERDDLRRKLLEEL